MNIGLIGAGNISETHARAAAGIEGVRIVAVLGRRRDRAERLAAQYDATAYDDLEAFLDHRPMDLVAIGTPPALHATQGIAAARRGLHVLVEKPIDATTTRADALISAATQHDVKLAVFFQGRFEPGIRRLKQLVDERTIGDPILASAHVKWYRPPRYYTEAPWRGSWALSGGGALMSQAIHTVDLLLWLLGPVRHVSARIATRLHAIEVEDTAVASLEFANGTLATLEAATSAFPGSPRRVALTGTRGTVVLEDDRLVSIDIEGGERSVQVPVVGSSASASSPVVADASGHRAVIEDFLHAIAHDRRPACDGEDARGSMALVEAIYESARSGVVQPIEPHTNISGRS
jgi:UDP-N-acetyl-2-amino-2-deoxyglucuronate dehydrogenase